MSSFRIGWLLTCSGLLGVAAVVGCGGTDGNTTSSAAGSGGTGGGAGGAGAGGEAGSGTGGDAGGGDGGDDLACDAFCATTVMCEPGVRLSACVEGCTVAPDLPTDACETAYSERNACVAALDCDEYASWSMPAGGVQPCSDEEAAITDACAS